jgi:threonine/homoserine/homoserine lactone efflux protein
MLEHTLKGIGIGFALAAPVGPIGMLCIRRSVSHGWRHGLATGLGAASADALYGCVAAFGLTAISAFLTSHADWIGLFGGAFLCYLGVKTFIPAQLPTDSGGDAVGLLSAYLTTFVLTLTNPATILSFVAVFAGLGLGLSPAKGGAASIVLGVFVGSALWWLLLSGSMSYIRTSITPQATRTIGILSGLILVGFGIIAFTHFFRNNTGPNKAMEPTPVNVTIPADAGLAPFTSAAHLDR